MRGLNPEVKFSSFMKKIPSNDLKIIDSIVKNKESNSECLNIEQNTGNNFGKDFDSEKKGIMILIILI